MALSRKPVDRWILGYLLFTSVIAMARLSAAPAAGWVLLANALVAVLVFLVGRPGLGRAGQALAELYPLFLVPALYGALDLLAGHAAVITHDPLIRRWEVQLFGTEISRTWWQQHPSVFWSTVLHSAYFAYYLIIPAGPLWFWARGDTRNLRRTVLAITVSFLLCYAVFLLFPVAGPYYEYPRPSAAFLDNGPARLVYGVLARGSSYGAAFPSSHVAACLAATWLTLRGNLRLGLVLAVPTVLLCVGVVYCQMHYVLDAVAGVVVAVGVVTVTGDR